eukprot:15359415-Alexandrium_andersonii.AAC.1
MSASLVGSEMCIRDRPSGPPHSSPRGQPPPGPAGNALPAHAGRHWQKNRLGWHPNKPQQPHARPQDWSVDLSCEALCRNA